jgi:acylphosphatase
MKKQIHAFFSGMVQGVGFRYTVRDIAIDLAINGWVRNLTDGRVEVLAEAKESDLKVFLEKINENFSQYIKNVEVEWFLKVDGFKDFNIVF